MIGPTRLAYAFRPRAPAGLLAGAAAVAVLFAATPFLVPEVAARFDVTEGRAGLISVAQVGAFAIVNLVLPRFVAPSALAWRMAAWGLVAANAASVALPSFSGLLAVRAVAGAAAGLLTWVAWSDAMRHPGSLAGIAATGPVTVLVGSPVIAALSGSGDRLVFAVMALAAVPAAAASPGPGVDAGRRSAVSRSRSNRILLAVLFVLTFSGSSLFIYEVVLARDELGVGPAVASLGFSLNAAGGLLGARLSSRHRRPGWWLATGGPAAYLTIRGGTQASYLVSMTWWGFAFWMGVPGILQMLAERSREPGERAGDAQALMAFGRALGPALGGVMTDAGAVTGLALVAGGGIAAAGLAVTGVQEGRERLPPTDPAFDPGPPHGGGG